MHDLETDSSLASRRPCDPPVGGQHGLCSARTRDPLEAAFESQLAAWLVWWEAARGAEADQHAMRRLELVCGAGWTAVTVVVLTIPLVGVMAAVLSVVLFTLTLVLAYVVTLPGPARHDATDGAAVAWGELSSLGPAERARLVRIMNLSRVAGRPAGARLLLRELDEVLAAEPLASWSPLRELRDSIRAGSFSPLESEALLSVWQPGTPPAEGLRHG